MPMLLYLAGIILLIYLLLLRGRTGKPELKPFRSCLFAHRGLYGDGVPENSLKAFRRAAEQGFGIELDVHLLKDGTLAVLHDSDLLRMTGQLGILESLSGEDLEFYRLQCSDQRIPTLSQVLDLIQGTVPLIIELKVRQANSSALCQAVCRQLDCYPGAFCLESFDPRCLMWLKKHRPELLRGQLSENFLKKKDSSLSWPLRFAASFHLESFLTRPDFIAHRFSDRRTLSNYLIRRLWQVAGITWTVRSQQELDTACREGWIPIFEGFLPSGPSK